MKNQPAIFWKCIRMFVIGTLILMTSASAFAQKQTEMNDAELFGASGSQIVRLTKSFYVRDEMLKLVKNGDDLRELIEEARSQATPDLIALTLIDGELVAAADPLAFKSWGQLVAMSFANAYRARLHSQQDAATRDFCFCVFFIKAGRLQRDEGQKQYVFSANQELIPRSHGADQPAYRAVLGAGLVEETFSTMSSDGSASDIPLVKCFRRWPKAKGLSTEEFIEAIGRNHVEVRNP